MRRSFVILAIGGGMVVAGFILLEVNTYSIGQGAQAQSFPIAILTLNPNEQKATQWRITETSHPVYLYLSNTDDLNNPLNPPPHVPIDIQVKDPTGQEVVSVSDSLKKFTKVVPSVQGDYSIYLTNKSDEDDAQIMISGTYGKLPSTGQELLDIAGPAIAGAIMMLIGIPILIVGSVLFLVDRRREKRNAESHA